MRSRASAGNAGIRNRAAIETVAKRLDRLVEKGRIDAGQRDAAMSRLVVASDADSMGDADLVIEAVVEDLDTKVRVLGSIIPSLRDDAIIASNTSALSISRLGEAIAEPHRTVGMHFFNPAPLMKLVEVIAGDQTERSVVEGVAAIAEGWGKVVAHAADVAGFIVNHVARPYYLEAFRILEDGIAGPDVIDDAMRNVGGFRMGPLELTDLIGQEVRLRSREGVLGLLFFQD